MSEVYYWVGLVVVNFALAALWLITWYFGQEVWRRATRIYSLTVIYYWLDRLEKEGTHTFERARQEATKASK